LEGLLRAAARCVKARLGDAVTVRSRRIWRILLLSLLAAGSLALLLRPAAIANGEPKVWVVSSLERVGRQAEAGSSRRLEIHAARGEWESFQLVIQAGREDISRADLRVSDLMGSGSRMIPKSAITLYREHYVHLPRPSPASGGPNKSMGAGHYADALIPLAWEAAPHPLVPFSVKAGFNQPIWGDILVPMEAPPGIYRTVLTMSLDGMPRSAEIVLVVRDFALPLVPTLNSAFLVWKPSQAVELELLKHKLMPRDVHLPNEKRLNADWGLKSTNIGLWSKATGKHCGMDPAPSLAEVRKAANAHHPALRRYNYTADEIDECSGLNDGIKAWGRVLHEAGVDNLVTMQPTPELYDDGSGSGRSAVDIWVLLPKMYERARRHVAEVIEKGDEVWSYNALVQDGYSPKWQIDYAPINFRIQPSFISQSLGLTGLLYWQVDRWTQDPWQDVYTYRNEDGEFPGEGMLVYPGAPMGFSGAGPSMRLKWIRDGVEDFEYVALLKGLGCRDLAMRMSREIGADWRLWSKDGDFLEEKRRTIADKIEEVRRTGQCG
jgi:Domain of unknown function (DUF4091)